MKINCDIAGDLLPLYLENLCSDGSRAALEEHLEHCEACREKMERMKKSDVLPKAATPKEDPPIAGYARRVRRHRVRVGIAAAAICALAVCVLAVIGLALLDLRRSESMSAIAVESGVCNLSAEPLETGAADIGQYVFYTNYEQIRVDVEMDGDFEGEVLLWDTQNPDSFIRIAEVSEKRDSVTFDGLTSAKRYKITCEGLTGAAVTVSDGRIVSFWNSLLSVLREIFGV